MNRPSSQHQPSQRDEGHIPSEMGVYTSHDDGDPVRGLFNGFLLSLVLWVLMIAGGCFAYEVISTVWGLLT